MAFFLIRLGIFLVSALGVFFLFMFLIGEKYFLNLSGINKKAVRYGTLFISVNVSLFLFFQIVFNQIPFSNIKATIFGFAMLLILIICVFILLIIFREPLTKKEEVYKRNHIFEYKNILGELNKN